MTHAAFSRLYRRVCGAIVLAVLTALPASAAQPVDLILRVEPAQTLPGLPVGLYVEVRNNTSLPLTFPFIARLDVISQDAERFSAIFDARGDRGALPLPDQADDTSPLLPGETRTVSAPLIPPTGPEWFSDHRLSRPGTYRLKFLIQPNDDSLHPGYESTEAVLTVRTPEGDDDKVWKLLQARTSDAGWGTTEWARTTGLEMARIIWRDYPTSTYAQYVALYIVNDNPKQRETILKQAIAVNERSVVADIYRLDLINLVLNRAMGCGSPQQPDVPCEAQYYRAAKPLLQTLANSATNSFIKRMATEKRDDVTERLSRAIR